MLKNDTFSIENAQHILNQFKEIQKSFPIVSEEALISLKVNQAERTVQEFKKLKFPKNRRKTFLEIVGLNRLESISSKTLEFFLNTEEEHELDDLVLQASLKCINKNFNHQLHTKNSKLEFSTNLGRIDIFIETDEFVVAIENKLDHHADNNPFDDYLTFLKEEYPAKEIFFILLAFDKPKTKKALPEEVQFVSHFELSHEILNNIGKKSLTANPYYLTFLLDYISTMEAQNPKSEQFKMSKQIVDFYRNNREMLEQIQDEQNKESVYQYYEQQVNEIIELLTTQGLLIFPNDLEFYRSEGDLSSIGGSFNSILLRSPQNEYQLEFEIYKSTGYTNLWCRRFKTAKMMKQDSIDLQNYLNQENILSLEQHNQHGVLLLEENESISTEDFVEKAAPIIKKILELHQIQIQ